MERSKVGRSWAILCSGILAVAACQAGPTPTPGPTATPTEVATPTATPSPLPGDVTGTLTVLDWAGYDAADFWIDFQQAHPNVTLNFELGGSDADIFGKMLAGDQADVFHPYSGYFGLYVDAGLVEVIDTSRLTNWDRVPEAFKKLGQFNGQQYFVPWDWGFTSILYRTDKVEGTIDTWNALFDETYKGHISMWDDGPGAVTIGSYVLGIDETQVTPVQLEQIKQMWIDQKALNLLYWASDAADLVPAMANGDVWVAYSWQGAYATLLGQGVPVAYADPKEGRNSWVGTYGIRKGSPNYELALRFLDLKLAEATMSNVVNLFYYGAANQDVMAAITDETLKQAFSIDDPTILQRTNFTPDVTDEQRNAWTNMWAEVKAAP